MQPGNIVTKSEYTDWKNKYEEHLRSYRKNKPKAKSLLKEPIKVEKRIEYKKNIKVNTYNVRESIQKIYYKVDYLYNVIFDASSGRVTLSEYFPFFVNKLHSKIIKEEGYL